MEKNKLFVAIVAMILIAVPSVFAATLTNAVASRNLPTLFNITFPVNGTSGFSIGGATQYIWTVAPVVNGSVNVVYSTQFDVNITDTNGNRLPMEVETGNASSLNSTQLYSNDELAHLRCGANSTTCSDSTKYGSNFTMGSRATWTSGMFGGGVVTQGVLDANGGLVYANSSWADLTNFAFVTWIRPRTTTGGTGAGTQRMIIVADNDESDEDTLLLEISKTALGDVSALIDNGGTFTYCTSPSSGYVQYDTNTWQMIAFTYTSATSNMLVYYNGEVVGNCTSAASTPIGISANNRILWGKSTNPSFYAFNGTMDELQIFNRTLTSTEIRAIYQADTSMSSFPTFYNTTLNLQLDPNFKYQENVTPIVQNVNFGTGSGILPYAKSIRIFTSPGGTELKSQVVPLTTDSAGRVITGRMIIIPSGSVSGNVTYFMTFTDNANYTGPTYTTDLQVGSNRVKNTFMSDVFTGGALNESRPIFTSDNNNWVYGGGGQDGLSEFGANLLVPGAGSCSLVSNYTLVAIYNCTNGPHSMEHWYYAYSTYKQMVVHTPSSTGATYNIMRPNQSTTNMVQYVFNTTSTALTTQVFNLSRGISGAWLSTTNVASFLVWSNVRNNSVGFVDNGGGGYDRYSAGCDFSGTTCTDRWDNSSFITEFWATGSSDSAKIDNATSYWKAFIQNPPVITLGNFTGIWANTNATARTEVIFENRQNQDLYNFPFLVSRNISGWSKSCVDTQFVNFTNNGAMNFELENNTCTANNVSTWWVRENFAPMNQNVTNFVYHNFSSPTDLSNKYGTWSDYYTYVFHGGENSASLQVNSKGGAGPNGTLTSDCQPSASGKFGRGWSCNGTSASNPGDQGLKILNGFNTAYGINNQNITIELWFNPSSSITSSTGLFGAASGSCEFDIFVGQGGGNGMRFFITNGTSNVLDSTISSVYNSNSWNYVVVSTDGKTSRVWVNGANILNSSWVGAGSICTTTNTIYVGSGPSGGVKDFNGTIDEFRLSPYNVSFLGGEAYVKANWEGGNSYFGATSTLSALSVLITAPTNGQYLKNLTFDLNYTITNTTQLDKCWYILNGGANTSLPSCANAVLTGIQNSNNVSVYVNDTTGTIASSNVLFTLDTIRPTVSIISPTNSSYAVTNISLTYTAVDTYAVTCQYELNGAGNVSLPSCGNTTFLGAQGNNIIKVFATDLAGNIGNATVNFFVDSLPPNITIQSPTNSTYNSNITVLNYSIIEASRDKCWYQLNGGGSVNLPSCANTTIEVPQGSNFLNVFVNDTTGSQTNASVSYFVDSIAPVVTIISPTNTSYAVTNITLTFTATDANRVTCKYELNGAANVTLTNCQNTTFIGVQGSNKLKVFANDTANNYGNTTVNFFIDSISPAVSITSPTNSSYTVTNITLTYTATDTNLDKCQYELNGAPNVSLPGCLGTTFIASQGNNRIKVFANDSVGNVGNASVNFFVDSIAPVVTIIAPTNTTYFVDNTSLIYTAVDANPVTCKYELNGAGNISIANCANITYHSPEGPNVVKVFATDGSGNIGSSTVNYYVHSEAPIITIQSPTNTTYYIRNIDLNYSIVELQLDKCWYVLDSSGNIALPSCANTTLTGLTSGFHKLWVYANDSAQFTNVTNVNFTVFQGVNLSVFNAQHSSIASWNVTFTNATNITTFTGLNNPALLRAENLPQGNVTITVIKGGYDTESFNVTVNLTMGVIQHDFTLYPFSYVYFYSSDTGYLTNWDLTITAPNGTTYINTTVPTFYTTSNRYLVIGNNTLGASILNSNARTTSVIVSNITGFNLTITTTQVIAKMWAWDELTRVKKGWNAQLTLGSNNLTATYVTGYRNGSTACWDGNDDISSTCVSVYDGSTSPNQASRIIIWGQDYNNATYNFSYGSTTDGGAGCENTDVWVYAIDKNGVQNLIYSDSFLNAPAGNTIHKSAIVTVPNTNATYDKATAFNLSVRGARCGPFGHYSYISDFRMLNNTAGYSYFDDYTVTIPNVLLSNYTKITVSFTGEETYQTQYTTQRDYIVTASPFADYNVIGYLLRDSGDSGYYQFFTILDANNQPIGGALMTLGRWYNGQENVVGQCETNAAGSCSFWMQSAQFLYSLRIEKSGYQTYYNQSSHYNAGQGTAYVYLTTGQVFDFTSPFNQLYVTLTPVDQYIRNATNASCISQAGLGNINYINFTVTRMASMNNFTRYASIYSISNPSGGTFSVPLVDNGQYQLRCDYEWVSNATGAATVYRNFNTKTIWVYNENMQNTWDQTGGSGWLGIIIALGIILIVCAPIAYISPTYAVAIGIFLLLIFSWVGMIPATMIFGKEVAGYMIAGLAILVAIALIFLRSFL